jgi:V8-like Glu-specific endopeptidase
MKNLLIYAMMFLSTNWVFAQNEPTERPDIPEPQPLEYPFANPDDTSRGVFGRDARKDIRDVKDIEDFSRATGALIMKSNLKGDRIVGESLRSRLTRQHGVNKFHENVKFLDQPACAFCTGFLIAPDLFVTAGHCVETMKDAKDIIIVFDYNLSSNSTTTSIPVKSQDVYTVKEVVTAYFKDISTMVDYSVLRLDRPSDRKPYRFRTSGNVSLFSNVYMIGAPSGLPMKFADNAWVMDNSPVNWFKNNVDGFPGNSGGPVYNQNGFIEGIHVRGAIELDNSGKARGDYIYDQECNCIKTVTFASALDNPGSQAHKITRIPLDVLHRAIYENLQYAIEKNNTQRFDDWTIYGWMIDHEYTVKRGRLEFLAAAKNNLGMLTKLLNISKKFDITDGQGRSLLFYAISNNNQEMVDYLLKQGVSPNQSDNNGNTPLSSAVNNGNSELVILLVSRGANVNQTAPYGNSPLHLAARRGDASIVRFLLEKGANLSVKNFDNQTPRKLAKKSKNKNIAKMLKRAEKGKSF